MLEVGYSEILVIAIVLIVVVGPKDLPKMLRAFGRMMTKFRTVSGDFRRQFDDALREAELDEVRKTIADVRNIDPRNQLRDAFNPLRSAAGSLRADVENGIKPAAATARPANRAMRIQRMVKRLPQSSLRNAQITLPSLASKAPPASRAPAPFTCASGCSCRTATR